MVTATAIKEYKGYIFDLDGTIYLENNLLPGALELIEGLRAQGRKVIFLSNNPTKNPEMYAEKLSRLGIPTDPSEVVNTLVAMVLWLKENARGKKVFAIAEQPLIDAIIAAGIEYPISGSTAIMAGITYNGGLISTYKSKDEVVKLTSGNPTLSSDSKSVETTGRNIAANLIELNVGIIF